MLFRSALLSSLENIQMQKSFVLYFSSNCGQGKRRTARLLRTLTRPAVGCGGVAGLSRASWPTSRPAITPACATLTSSPGVLIHRGSSRERRPTLTATTATMVAVTSTTTSMNIIGLGRSMTKSLQHSKTSSADCDLIWPCILIFSCAM